MSTEARVHGAAPAGGRTTFGEPDVRADTLADRAEFLTARLTPVACRACGTEVLVRKNSEQHTSIQWTSDPASSCPRYADEVARGGSTALLDTCPRLSESIAQEAAEGAIPIGSEDCSRVRTIGHEEGS